MIKDATEKMLPLDTEVDEETAEMGIRSYLSLEGPATTFKFISIIPMLNDCGALLSDTLLSAISEYQKGRFDSFKTIVEGALHNLRKLV